MTRPGYTIPVPAAQRLHYCGAVLTPLYPGSAWARCPACKLNVHIGAPK